MWLSKSTTEAFLVPFGRSLFMRGIRAFFVRKPHFKIPHSPPATPLMRHHSRFPSQKQSLRALQDKTDNQRLSDPQT